MNTTSMRINEVSLRDVVIEFLEKIDTTQNHIHLRIGNDGVAYVSEDTGYCIGEDEFNKTPGHTVTVKYQRGHGQCELSDNWYADEMDDIQGFIDEVIADLSRAGYECELV